MGASPSNTAAAPGGSASQATKRLASLNKGKLKTVEKTVPKELRISVASVALDPVSNNPKRSVKRRKPTPIKCVVKVEVSVLRPEANTLTDVDGAARLLCDVRSATLEPSLYGTVSLELIGLKDFVYDADTLLVLETPSSKWRKTLAKNYNVRITISFISASDMMQVLDFLSLTAPAHEETCFYADVPSTHIPFPGQNPMKSIPLRQKTSSTSMTTVIQLKTSVKWIARAPPLATKKMKIELRTGIDGMGLTCPFCGHERPHQAGLVEHIEHSHPHAPPSLFDFCLPSKTAADEAPKHTALTESEPIDSTTQVSLAFSKKTSSTELDIPFPSADAAKHQEGSGTTTFQPSAPLSPSGPGTSQVTHHITLNKIDSLETAKPPVITASSRKPTSMPQDHARAASVVSERRTPVEPLQNIEDLTNEVDQDSLFEETLMSDPQRADSGIGLPEGAESAGNGKPAGRDVARETSQLAVEIEQLVVSDEPWITHGLPRPVLPPYAVPKLAKPDMVLFKEVTLRPLKEDEQVVEYEEQIDETWGRMRQDQTIDADEAMSATQKSLMKRWNHQMLEERLNGNKFLGEAILRFTRANKSWLQGKEHFRELLRLLGSVRADKIINDKDVAACIAIVQDKEKDDSPASRVAARGRLKKAKAKAQGKAIPAETVPRDDLPPQREAKYIKVKQTDWASTCSCGQQVFDLSQLIICENPVSASNVNYEFLWYIANVFQRCRSQEYHMKCVGLEGLVEGWVCDDCSA
jgi:hypothetical protein